MADGLLWGTSIKGNVYQLSVQSNAWIKIPNQEKFLKGFKKVVGHALGAWGLGCDSLVYVFVNRSDVPLLAREIVWENEVSIP